MAATVSSPSLPSFTPLPQVLKLITRSVVSAPDGAAKAKIAMVSIVRLVPISRQANRGKA